MRHPFAVWPLLICVNLVAVFGVARLAYDDGLIRTFKSDLARYRDYAAFLDRFESDARDVLILFEGRDMADPAVLEALRDFLLDLQFVEGVSGVISPFGLRVTAPDGRTEPLVPDPLPSMAEMQARFDAESAASPELGRVLSAGRRMLLVMVPLGDATEEIATRGRMLGEVGQLASNTAEAVGLRVTLTGYPVLRDRISNAIFDDMVVLNLVGAAMGIAVAALSLRSLWLGILTGLAPLTALLWVLAMLGYLGIGINVITVALPVLILVLATSDAIHLSIEAARLHRSGVPHPEIAAVRRISPACVLAALTTAAAFLALTMSSSALIDELGRAGAVAVLLSVAAVLVTHPVVFLTAAHLGGRDRLYTGNRGIPPAWLDLSALPAIACRAPVAIAAASLAGLVLAGVFYAQIEPRYSLHGDLRAGDDGVEALRRIDAELFPTGSLQLPVRIGSTADVAAAHAAVEAAAPGSVVVSLASLAERAAARGQSPDEVLAGLPTAVARRLVSEDGGEAVISVQFPYVGSGDTRARTVALEAALAQTAPDGMAFGPATGIAVMTAFVSRDVLLHLNLSFLAAVAAAGLLILAWLRRPLIAAVALLPNILPIACVGAWLALSGTGLGFAGGLAMTIAFGIAIDDTVHVLNRMRLAGGLDTPGDARRVCAATQEVAPALVITSLVLAMGMTGTLFAQLTTVMAFGMLSIAVFVLALVADLVVLPASLVAFGRLRSSARQGRTP